MNNEENIVLLNDDNSELKIFINSMKRQNYTPFGMEFKRFTSSQLYNYGMNFSFEIPVVGNILYRSFFEIELPVISFNDNFITNTTYKQLKINNLNNIQTEIDKWQENYDTMKSFSNIMIEVYVEVKKILKLQNITLNVLQSRVLTIINKYGDNLYKYRLLIDPNILNNVDIAAYIINLTQLNLTTISTTIDAMYNNNINYLNYYMGNINYYNKEYIKINNGEIFCKWIDHIGHYYFNYFELVVNGLTVDNYSNDFLHINQSQSVASEYLENYNRLIGNTNEIYINKGSPNYIYTPLIFSFNNINEPSQALPLVGMMNSSIKINSRVNDLKTLVYMQDWKAMYEELKIIILRRDQHTVDENNGITPYDLPYDNIELLLPSYIYKYYCTIVDKRVLDAKYPGIDSDNILLYYGSDYEDSDGNIIRILTQDDFIYFMNIIRTEKKILDENSKIAIAGYHYFIDYNYYLNLISKPKVSLLIEYGYIDNYEKQIMANNRLDYIIETHHEIILDVNNSSLFDSLNSINGLVKDIYVFGREKLNLVGVSKYGKSDYTNFNTNIIENIELKISNDYNLYENYTIGLDSYSNVTSYILNSPVPSGVWYKTFSLNPYSIQPSGFINMNYIVGQNIAVIVNDTLNNAYFNSKINPYHLGIEFKIMYTKYNIMKVANGNMELTFYN